MIPFHYKCSECGREFKRDEVRYLCPDCEENYRPGIPLRGVLEVEFDPEALRRRVDPHSRDWQQWLPIESEYLPSYPVGHTPFFRSPRLCKVTGFDQLWIKNDGQNPSGSLKDRASYLVVAEANRLQESTVVTASTGNAASALAAVCAAAGKQALIFVPENAPKAKLVQMLICGAQVVRVKGTYDDAFRLSLEWTQRYPGINRNTAYHPLTIEGKKTVGCEILQQGGSVPDAILIPVGDGVILAGVHKAFRDWKAAGFSDQLPRLICVQAESSNAIHHYFSTGKYTDASHPATVADSISVSIPSNAHLAKRAIEESKGSSVIVSDQEILAAQYQLAGASGIFAEPAAAASLAGLHRCREQQLLDRHERIVLLVTGHGLKDIPAAERSIMLPDPIEPTSDSLSEVAKKLGLERS